MFEDIAGHEQIKSYLSRLLAKDAIPHLLLFAGPHGANKTAFAKSFAKALVKTDQIPHPDIQILAPEGKLGMHSIEAMRQLSREVYLPPYQSAYKLFIIQDAERMLATSANAVLKTFEEPAPRSIIILLSSAPESLLPTVLSRCQIVRFQQQTLQTAPTPEQTPLRTLILDLLTRGPALAYTDLLQSITQICEQIDVAQQALEELTRQELEKQYMEGIGAAQQQAIEKEIDGVKSIHLMHQIEMLFDSILAWYRDMQLLMVQGNREYLIHRDYERQLAVAIQRGEAQPLERVQTILQKTRTALERSGSLSSCLESLFLELY